MMNMTENVLRSEEFDLENPRVEINVRSSRVEVRKSEDGRVKVVVTGDSEEAALLAKSAEISAQGRSVSIRLEKSKGSFRELFKGKFSSIGLIVYLPASAQVDINSVSANVEINQNVVDLDLKTVSGDSNINFNPTGKCSVKSVSGDISARTQSSCIYDFKSVSGDIKVFVVPGLEIDVDGNSVSGQLSSEIALGNGAADAGPASGTVSIDAKTVSGDFSLARS
jgi:DUF4097 and DUF4098 domain-containing protein YvlB